MKNTSVLLAALVAVTLSVGLAHAQPPPPPGGAPPPPAAGAPPPRVAGAPQPGPDAPPPPMPRRTDPGLGAINSHRGTIRAFNSGPQGERNGLILNDGTVVLFPPQAGAPWLGSLREGSRVSVTGVGRTAAEGRMVLNAQSITANGQTFAIAAGPDGQPGPRPGGRRGKVRGPGGPPPPPPAQNRP